MKIVRKSRERANLKFGWLETFHSFSFGSYFDPKWMGFGKLRVINEDIIDEGMGFDTHPHRDMEILTLILEGAIEHRDTMGHHTIIRPGEIQIMSAGTGLMHSEYNPHKDQKTHMLQIWIEPNKLGLKPRYEQISYQMGVDEFKVLVDADGGEGVAKIYQDAKILMGQFKPDVSYDYSLSPSRRYWLQIISGELSCDGEGLQAGDAIAFEGETKLNLNFQTDSQLILFDLN